MPLAADCRCLAPASASDSPVKTVEGVCNGLYVSFSGGKAFGLLKAQQRERLEEVNKVKEQTLENYYCLSVGARCFMCAARLFRWP